MKIFAVLAYICLMCDVAKSPVYVHFWVVWNIGQGQWITEVQSDRCRHFDFGGEIQYFSSVQSQFISLCSGKENQLYLSHADYDHYSFYDIIKNRAKETCWMVKPIDVDAKLKSKINFCNSGLESSSSLINTNQTLIVECSGKNRNSCSTVFKRKNILIPGDSPKSKEKLWIQDLMAANEIEILILGHHGSKTSTDQRLLKTLPNLKMTIASARKLKYGHPHVETKKKLRALRIPLLSTENWGNIIIE